MGFRIEQTHKIENTEEKGNEIREQANDQLGKAREIKGILEQIHVADDSDISLIENTESGYQGSFDTTYESTTEQGASEVGNHFESINGEVKEETENVSEAIELANEAGSVSEIGRENAESAASGLESSKQEYESMSERIETSKEQLEEEIASRKSELGSVFG